MRDVADSNPAQDSSVSVSIFGKHIALGVCICLALSFMYSTYIHVRVYVREEAGNALCTKAPLQWSVQTKALCGTEYLFLPSGGIV